MGSLNEHSNDLQTLAGRLRRGRSGKGFGSVDAAYREATKKTRPKHKIETKYYAARTTTQKSGSENWKKINEIMSKYSRSRSGAASSRNYNE